MGKQSRIIQNPRRTSLIQLMWTIWKTGMTKIQALQKQRYSGRIAFSVWFKSRPPNHMLLSPNRSLKYILFLCCNSVLVPHSTLIVNFLLEEVTIYTFYQSCQLMHKRTQPPFVGAKNRNLCTLMIIYSYFRIFNIWTTRTINKL